MGLAIPGFGIGRDNNLVCPRVLSEFDGVIERLDIVKFV